MGSFITRPKVSVVVPIYGVEKYIHQCVDSILRQTLQDIEVILVDDGSKDRCPQIVDEYAKNDRRVVAIHQPNGGYGRAVNHGIEVARGEYIGIVEPDDYIDEEMYETMYHSAKEHDTDITKSLFYMRYEYDSYEEPVRWDTSNFPTGILSISDYSYFLYTHPSIWSCIYRREFLTTNNIKLVEPKGAGWADNPFQVATFCLARRINFINIPFYHYRKFNRNESDDLKDYKIPFERSDEIHSWLDHHHVTDNHILVNLYKRELAYIHIVFGMKGILLPSDCYKRIKKMVMRFEEELFLNSPHTTKLEKKRFLLIKQNPRTFHLKSRWKRLRKKNHQHTTSKGYEIHLIIRENSIRKSKIKFLNGSIS